MFEANKQIRRPIWSNFAVLVLLVVTSGFILSACKKPNVRSKSEAQKENHPAKVEQHKSSNKLKQKESDKPHQKRDKDDDTPDDDDPE